MKYFRNIFFININLLLFFCHHNKNQSTELKILASISPTFTIESFFTYPGRFSPDEKKLNVQNEIVQLIDNSKNRIDIYAYSFTNQKILDALNSAKNRRIEIYFTGDKQTEYPEFIQELPNFKVWTSSSIHHLKVMIFDQNTVFFGTGNFTEFGLKNDHNGFIKFPISLDEFNNFYDFLELKSESPKFSLNEIEFINSPKNGKNIQNIILQNLENAKTSIRYLTYNHTDEIISHMIRKKSEQGVVVEGIYNSPISDEGLYLNKQIFGFNSKIYEESNEDTVELNGMLNGGLLHHKTILIDDQILLSGSYNFSKNARDANREILFKTTNSSVVKEFLLEFERIKEFARLKSENNFFQHFISANINLQLDKEQICFPFEIFNPIIELGEGIWKTILFYQNEQAVNCILKTGYDKISTSFSNFKDENLLELDLFWDKAIIFERNSNQIYQDEKEFDSIFYSKKDLSYLELENFSLIDSKTIHFKLKNSLDASKIINIQNLKPGKYFLNLEYQIKENEFLILGKEKFQSGVILIESNDLIYFFCIKEKNDSSAFIDFLLDEYRMNHSVKDEILIKSYIL